jgi:GNAT superfamily N-acetyltransferase
MRRIVKIDIVSLGLAAQNDEFNEFLAENGDGNLDLDPDRVPRAVASGIVLEARCGLGRLVGLTGIERVEGARPDKSVWRSGLTAVHKNWQNIGIGKHFIANRRIMSLLAEGDLDDLYFTEIYDSAAASIHNHKSLGFDLVAGNEIPDVVQAGLYDHHNKGRETLVFRGGIESIQACARHLVSHIDHPVRTTKEGFSVEWVFSESLGFGKNAPEIVEYVRELIDLSWRRHRAAPFSSYFLHI